MNFYFLKEDLDELNKKISELMEELNKFTLEIGKDYQEDRGIFTFEEGERQKQMMSRRLQELIQIRNNAVIATPNGCLKEVGFGRRVTFEDKETSEVFKYKIGSYMVFFENDNVISYEAPLARLLVGSKVGDVKEGLIGSKKRIFQILNIE